MGNLIPQPILTLFGGVSRQPVNVRRENQVEEAINALPSIVSGGIEKRPALQYLNKLRTLENLLLYSQDFGQADWTKSDATATLLGQTNYAHPQTPDYFSLEDTSGTNKGYISQTATVTNSGEYIFSIDVAPGTITDVSIEIEYGDASKATLNVDLDAGEVSSYSGDRFVAGEIEPIDTLWSRLSIRADNATSQTSLTVRLLLGALGSETGLVYATRAQLEKVAYTDQTSASPYAYTTDLSFPRQDLPGTNNEEYHVHKIDRDNTEQYMLLLADGYIHVYDAITGDAKQVIIKDSTRYFATDIPLDELGSNRLFIQPASDETDIDYTIKWRDAAGSPVVKIYHSDDGESWTEKHSESIATADGSSDTTETIGSATYVKVEVTTFGTAGTVSVTGTYRDIRYLTTGAPDPEDFAAVSIADYTFISNRNVTVALGGSGHPDGLTVEQGSYQDFSKLPTASATYLDKLAYIRGDDVDEFEGYWVVCVQDGSSYYWEETTAPDVQNEFDPATMPWQLIRTEEGWFELSSSEWASRPSGDDETNPAPSFVDEGITYVSFYRGRFVVLAGEQCVLSDAVDNTSFFAEKAVDVLDTDPIDRNAGTDKISILQACVPFRKVLFVTSSTMQFELSAVDKLTPETASLDVTTQYASSEFCKPTLMGDTLYFAATRPGGNTVYEYYYDEDTLNNTGVDITKHIGNYIPGNIIQMQADPVTGTLFVLTDGANASVYVYRTFWDNNDKVMSAWTQYTFGDEETTFIHGIAVFSGYLVVILENENGIFITQMTVDTEANHDNFNYAPLLDFRCLVQGIYDSDDDETRWIVPFGPTADTIVLTNDDQPGRILNTEIDGEYLVASGDYSSDPAYVGNRYNYYVELSPLFPRNPDGATISEGEYKVKDLILNYANTGYFEVNVTPEYRDTYTYEFTGYIVSGQSTKIGEQPVLSGKFSVPIITEGKTVKITIENDTPLPTVITSGVVRGFYSEISRSK